MRDRAQSRSLFNPPQFCEIRDRSKNGPVPSQFHCRRHVFLHRDARDRTSRALIDHIEALRTAVKETHAAHPFAIDAIVILPDHMHIVMTLPEGDADYPTRLSLIKRRFTDAVVKSGAPVAPRRNGEIRLWQRRFWEHTIGDERDFERHVDYVHFNPVKHRLVGRVCDWPYSTFHRYVRRGLLPQDWGGNSAQGHASFGERRS